MANIKINSGIKRYSIENENGEVYASFAINTSDATLYDKFVELLSKSKNISERAERNLLKFKGEKLNLEDASRITDISNGAVLELIDETDKLFGDGFVKELFKENFAINKDFIPDVTMLFDFYEQVIPLFEEIFKNKVKKYSSSFKGSR